MNLTPHQKKKKARGLCVECRCTNRRVEGRNVCDRHRMKRWAANNPERYAYNNLRGNANRRGKEFTLTFDEFMEFLKENPNYMKKKGTSVKSLQIDRKKNHIGYTKDNIQCITMRENVHKQHTVDYQTEDPDAPNYVPF